MVMIRAAAGMAAPFRRGGIIMEIAKKLTRGRTTAQLNLWFGLVGVFFLLLLSPDDTPDRAVWLEVR